MRKRGNHIGSVHPMLNPGSVVLCFLIAVVLELIRHWIKHLRIPWIIIFSLNEEMANNNIAIWYLTLVWTATNWCCSSPTNFVSLISWPYWRPIPSVRLWNTTPTLFRNDFKAFKVPTTWETSNLVWSAILPTVNVCGVAALIQITSRPRVLLNSGRLGTHC